MGARLRTRAPTTVADARRLGWVELLGGGVPPPLRRRRRLSGLRMAVTTRARRGVTDDSVLGVDAAPGGRRHCSSPASSVQYEKTALLLRWPSYQGPRQRREAALVDDPAAPPRPPRLQFVSASFLFLPQMRPRVGWSNHRRGDKEASKDDE